MAKATNTVILTTSWAEISAGGDTVLVSMDLARAGIAFIAVADAGTDLSDETDLGHRMTPTDYSVMNFFGLDGKKVCARKAIASQTVAVVVTEYSPVA